MNLTCLEEEMEANRGEALLFSSLICWLLNSGKCLSRDYSCPGHGPEPRDPVVGNKGAVLLCFVASGEAGIKLEEAQKDNREL